MPDKLFLNADDIVEIMGIAKPTAYKLMKQLNEELEAEGYIVICGKISTQYFFERCGLKHLLKERTNP